MIERVSQNPRSQSYPFTPFLSSFSTIGSCGLVSIGDADSGSGEAIFRIAVAAELWGD